MSRILFLDDCPTRQKWAKEKFDGGDNFFGEALTAKEAIGWLEWGEPEGFWDTVYLDHDLGDEVYVDSERADCGFEVVRWIVANKPTIGSIVVHTMNTPAGHGMVRDLREAGYSAKYKSFYRMVHDGEAKK